MASRTKDELKMLQALPLDVKIAKTQQRIREWYDHWGGEVYVSFSGGKDSTVLLDLVHGLYPDVPAVFVDTGLEYPEIRDFVKTKENVVWLKPEMPFNKVIENYGYPIISKDVAMVTRYAQRNAEWAKLRFQGRNADGSISKYKQSAYIKYSYLVDAPFKVSEQCCLVMKKEPAKRYEQESGRHPFVGSMASEGRIDKNHGSLMDAMLLNPGVQCQILSHSGQNKMF